ncbi:MAG: hypothetical protein V3V67_12645 [Myxococcota bacterium]
MSERRREDRASGVPCRLGTTVEKSAPRRAAPPRALLEAWRSRDWPRSLLERALELRLPLATLESWAEHAGASLVAIEQQLEDRERLITGTLRVRQAGWEDREQLAELWANSPEELGDWELTVERSPNPFAQLRLQENGELSIVEDRGLILGCFGLSTRNTMIGGKRTTVAMTSALRIRREARGRGFVRLLHRGFLTPPIGAGSYTLVRQDNLAAAALVRSVSASPPDPQPGRATPGVPTSVHALEARPSAVESPGIRLAGRQDLPACVSLINRTHGGLDLFRPYTEEFLGDQLDEGWWVDKPDGWDHVYGWRDFRVLVEDERIVACAGLWDRGRDIRERWRRRDGGEARVIANTALLDFGYAEGRAAAMVRLIEHLRGVTAQLGRQHLMLPLGAHEELAHEVDAADVRAETRGLVFTRSPGAALELEPERIHLDLRYW